MKNSIVIIFTCISIFHVQAQNFYKDREHVTADGITFKVSFDTYIFSLSNVLNTRDEIPNWYYKDGTELITEEEINAVFFKPFPGTIERAVRETFTEEDVAPLRLLREAPIAVYYVIGSDGELLEVAFIIDAIPQMLSLPPSKFALLEKNLKKYVKFKVGYFAQKLQFMTGDGFINFSKMDQLPPGKEMPAAPEPAH